MDEIKAASAAAQQRCQEAEEEAITVEMKMKRTETKLAELTSELERFRGVERALDAPRDGDGDDASEGDVPARLIADVLTALECAKPCDIVATIAALQESLKAAQQSQTEWEAKLEALQQSWNSSS